MTSYLTKPEMDASYNLSAWLAVRQPQPLLRDAPFIGAKLLTWVAFQSAPIGDLLEASCRVLDVTLLDDWLAGRLISEMSEFLSPAWELGLGCPGMLGMLRPCRSADAGAMARVVRQDGLAGGTAGSEAEHMHHLAADDGHASWKAMKDAPGSSVSGRPVSGRG